MTVKEPKVVKLSSIEELTKVAEHVQGRHYGARILKDLNAAPQQEGICDWLGLANSHAQ